MGFWNLPSQRELCKRNLPGGRGIARHQLSGVFDLHERDVGSRGSLDGAGFSKSVESTGDINMIYRLSPDYFVRPLVEDDVDGPYPTWFEDQEVCRYNSHGKFFKAKSYFREYVRGLDHEGSLVWAICHDSDGHIGNISLQKISPLNRTAEFAIILGDKRHWGKSVGMLAAKKMLEHGFQKMNLERVYCGTAAGNVGMMKLASALHMTLEGTRRSHLFLEGTRVDVLEYGVLRYEFENETD